MTNEEALEIIDDTLGAGRISAEAENIAFWETVRAAVEKQIPKKLHIPKKGFWRCPTCGTIPGDGNFCPICGQALDWRKSYETNI